MKPEKESQYRERYTQAVKTFLASPEANIEFSRELYWQLKSEFSDCQKRMSRWAFYSVILICIFELLNRRLIGGASFFGIQIGRLGFLTYFLPPAVAFCIANVLALAYDRFNYGNVMTALTEQKFPGLFASRISSLFASDSGLFSSDVPDNLTTRIGKFNSSLLLYAQAIFLVMGWLIFEVYAYAELFRHTKHFNGATVVSLLVTAPFIITIVLRFIEIVLDPAVPS